ncbi:MAG: hypothetical protein EOP55_19170 [Sphingobacteriales bacterium]|nr:MAG: hypothetical protein EOP55_19170 [Sphingobacteriales bacterium]
MAQIPFSFRELKRAWNSLHAASQQTQKSNAHRLLLFYAIECGLKAMWLKQENRTIFSSEEIQRTGHDLNDVIKQLRLGKKITPDIFHLCDLKNEKRNNISRKGNRLDTLHQAWRYGGQLEAVPADDKKMEAELEQINLLIEKELNS